MNVPRLPTSPATHVQAVSLIPLPPHCAVRSILVMKSAGTAQLVATGARLQLPRRKMPVR
uniref:Uncharacterized protein n=1 Tax=Arundo donax TaxID=35708 RepID=A0A0A8Z4S3_ARUDO